MLFRAVGVEVLEDKDILVKNAIGNLLPRRVKRAIRRALYRRSLSKEFKLDRQRYFEAALERESAEGIVGANLEAQLTKDYHRVEKGLALADPKRPFGAEVRRRLRALLPVAQQEESGKEYVEYAASALDALDDWNSNGIRAEIISPTREITDRGLADVDKFFETRHSVRNFSDIDVTDEVLNYAIHLATQTPSVCNRQSWRVRFFRGADARGALRFQNGNRGFGDDIPVVALVTVDSRFFSGVTERNQGWIEGGLFSMSLGWALHAIGLDFCMLNLSLTNEVHAKLRAQTGVSDHELLVMMIGIGYGAENHRRARSPRRSIEQVRLR